ncbi:MAG: hypothetical protein IPP94_13740 [Ignavibacteria bacterium]|nr:hypothetical protein [Ignavibacteria bacterium]
MTARVQQTQAQSDVESARNELGKAVHALNYALGRGADLSVRDYVLVDTLAYISQMYDVDSLIRRAYPQTRNFKRRNSGVMLPHTIVA